VDIITECDVQNIRPQFNGEFQLTTSIGMMDANRVILATGGSPKASGLGWVKDLGHSIEEPVPSLFTFNVEDTVLHSLSGIAVNPAKVKIVDSRYEFNGPVLITHWGLSGPAILKLSSFAAKYLAEKEYNFSVQINWLNEKKEDVARLELMNLKAANPNKHIGNLFPYVLPKRLMKYLFDKAGIEESRNWAEISKDQVNKLIGNLIYDTYEVKSKTMYKEEFVTCGGVSLSDINFKTMESKRVKGLYIIGEMLDIDGITGGFNFQSAWSTGYIAGNAAAK
jgi:hypothetical protein